MKNGNIWILFTVIVLCSGFWMVIVPSLENSASINFENTYSKLEQNINIILENKPNMTDNDRKSYIDNSCDIVFNNSNYRKGDSELCKLLMK